jgi:sulfite reductase alpha subunit-like flavoprotein
VRSHSFSFIVCREKIPVWIQKGTLTLPPPDVPLVCVGAGTGVAPLRSFLHHRAALAHAGTAVAPSVLVFGCRNQEKDWLYQDEWPKLQRAGALRQDVGIQTAFSRDQPQKVYVQHLVRTGGSWLWPMLMDGGACVFVTGSANKMPAAVAAAVEAVISEGLGCDASVAQKMRLQLARAGRYAVEAWS